MRFSYTTYEAGILQARAYRALRSFMRSELKVYNLSMMEWALLGLVADTDKAGIRATDLAARLDIEVSLVTNMVNKLQRQKMLKRKVAKADRREKMIILSPGAVRKISRIEQQLRSSLKTWLSDVTLRELKSYISTLTKIAAKS